MDPGRLGSCPSEGDTSGVSGEIGGKAEDFKWDGSGETPQGLGLVVADLHHEVPARPQEPRGGRQDRPVGVEAVGAAVEGPRRVVLPDLRLVAKITSDVAEFETAGLPPPETKVMRGGEIVQGAIEESETA